MTSRGMWVLAMALILCACGGGPAAPSPADTGDGITIFADPQFRGSLHDPARSRRRPRRSRRGCSKGTTRVLDLNYDDCISSIRIPAGRKVTVYEDPRYRGNSVIFTSDVMDLDDVRGPCGGDWDDCILLTLAC